MAVNITDNTTHETILDPFNEEAPAMPAVWSAIVILILLLKFIVGIVGLATNIFLVITILRFKKLKTRINSFILSITILNIIQYIATPISEIVFIFVKDYDIALNVFILLDFLEVTCIFFTYVIAVAMALDWFMMTFKQNWILRTKPLYKYELLILHMLALLWWAIQIYLHYEFNIYIEIITYIIGYCIIVFILLFINIYIKLHEIPYECTKTKYSITVANILLLCYLPEFIKCLLLIKGFNSIIIMFRCIEAISILSVYASPIILVSYLGCSNKYFKMAFDKSFKKNVQTYDTDNLDDPEDSERC